MFYNLNQFVFNHNKINLAKRTFTLCYYMRYYGKNEAKAPVEKDERNKRQ